MAGNIRAFLAELVGTFTWVLFAAGVVCADALSGGAIGPTGRALSVGLTLAGIFVILGRHSIGLFNPALTAGMLAIRRLEPARAALSLLCQLLGAALAGLLLAATFKHTALIAEAPFLGTPVPHVGYRTATLLEAVATMLLAMAAYRTAGHATKAHTAARAIAVGAIGAAAALFLDPLTGCALNPARAFAPALLSGSWSQHYVYWMGPLTGGVVGTALSRFLFES